MDKVLLTQNLILFNSLILFIFLFFNSKSYINIFIYFELVLLNLFLFLNCIGIQNDSLNWIALVIFLLIVSTIELVFLMNLIIKLTKFNALLFLSFFNENKLKW